MFSKQRATIKWFSAHMILSVILLTIFSFPFCQSYFGCVFRAIHIFWAIFYYSWAISYILDAYSNTFFSDQLIMISDVNSKLLIKKIIGEWKYREKNMNYYDNVKRNRDDTMRIFVKFTKFMRCLNFVKAFYGWLFTNSRNGRKNTRLLAEQRTYLTFYFDLKENKRYFYEESDISLEWSES